MSPPKCPVHNVEMELKIARRGKNAGGKFWGCPTWRSTGCRETLPFEDQNNIQEQSSPGEKKIFVYSFPRIMRARAKFQGYNVRFIESVALPQTVLENIFYGDFPENIIKVFTQWRLDFPQAQEDIIFEEKERQIISVAEKILTRGRYTLCSHKQEQIFAKEFLHKEKSTSASAFSEHLALFYVNQTTNDYWFDSPAEQKFYQEYIPSLLGPSFLHWILPQVEISSLILPQIVSEISGRVDFLINHPLHKPIIVEIDGKKGHESHINVDENRDEVLKREGYQIIRIPAFELEQLEGEKLAVLTTLLSNINNLSVSMDDNDDLKKYILAHKMAHQIQFVLVQAIQAGFLKINDISKWKISTDLDKIDIYNDDEAQLVFQTAIKDLIILLRYLGELYSVSVCNGEPELLKNSSKDSLHISFSGNTINSSRTFFIQGISFPFQIANSVFSSSPAILEKPNLDILEYFLQYIFRKPSFWEGQVDAIIRTLGGKDSIVLLPTGAGKSIAFQLAAMLLPGRAIVIDPIIALMDDQIDNLQSIGIDRAVAITSQIIDPNDRSRILSLFGQGEYLFAYIAPERFQTIEFREALRSLTTHTPISLIAVDEAHCVSEWGHDFRTAYLNIGRTSRIYCESSGITPPLLALTGTASRAVLKDVQRELQIEDFDAIITPKSFNRPELKFMIFSSSSAEKSARLIGFLGQTLPNKFSSPPSTFYQPNGKSTYAGLVFCPHVDGDFGVVEISNKIKTSLGVQTSYYSGRQPKYYSNQSWGFAKQAIAGQFKHNQIPLLVCTKAFGMGIDKPNIRYTIHYGIPSSIESFYQEAGRAGRDRKNSYCCILVSDDDPERNKNLLNPNTKSDEIYEIINELKWEENDDVTRALYFQSKAFPGILTEKRRVERVLNELSNISRKETKVIILTDLKRNHVEKSLHRLLLLNVIEDYTINYNSDEFTVKLTGSSKETIIYAYGKYVGGYLKGRKQVELDKTRHFVNLPYVEFVLSMVELLLNFIYDVIERGRRRALYEMLLAATVSPSDSSIRQRILRYLEATEYTEALEQIIEDSNVGLKKTKDVFEVIRSPNEAAEIRGQVARYLESYPDHPALLMLRALSEIYCRDKNIEITKQNFLASVASAVDNYQIKDIPLFEFIVWSLVKIYDRNFNLAQQLQLDILKKYPKTELARTFIKKSEIPLAVLPAWFLVVRLINHSKRILQK